MESPLQSESTLAGFKPRVSFLASVQLTILLMVMIAATILIGAWCPQESQGGFEKVIEVFGLQTSLELRRWGVTDIFHTPYFLTLIALLTLNMIACSFQRVFPKIRHLRLKLPFLNAPAISKLSVSKEIALNGPKEEVFQTLLADLKRQGYSLSTKQPESAQLTGEWGKVGRLAATVTHIGLLSLMLGVTITSWTGFTGFKPVPEEGFLDFAKSEHSKMWVGKLPTWRVHVDSTRREDYESGDPKQWYSQLTVVDKDGHKQKSQEISVNNPLSYNGVDIYQSSWGLDQIRLGFNDRPFQLPVNQMGGTFAAMLPLEEGVPFDQNTVLIFSLRGHDKPLKVFAKTPNWRQPKQLAEIKRGESTMFGTIKVTYIKPVPVTGLQYKSDPGLPITYVAFCIIMLGVLMAAIPHRQVWASVEEIDPDLGLNSSPEIAGSPIVRLSIGGVSHKAKSAFEKSLTRTLNSLDTKFGSRQINEGASSDSAPLPTANGVHV